MALHKKYQRLHKATQSFDSFNHIVELITVGLFFTAAIAVGNKVMPKKLLDYEIFDLSWRTIGTIFFIFLVMFFTQLSRLSRQRELSAFEREATIKAVPKNRYRR